MFDAPVVGIIGPNGIGKTNLLDAIYYLCYTKSYFHSREASNAMTGTEGFRIEGHFREPGRPMSGAEQKVCCIWRNGKKTLSFNEAAYDRVLDHIGRFTAVMIAPDDIELINGGSELRRKFFDGLLAQSDPDYLRHLMAYQKYLSQRNAYLKQQSGDVRHDLLDVYDERLAFHGAYLVQQRAGMKDEFPQWVKEYYGVMSQGTEPVEIHYQSMGDANELKARIEKSREKDLLYKRTLVGPHMEDWQLFVKGHPLKGHASQGQKKSFLIALKLAHIAWLRQIGKTPFLLLDDIFEKLDEGRLERLFGLLQEGPLSQIFMSHTGKEAWQGHMAPFFPDAQVIELSR